MNEINSEQKNKSPSLGEGGLDGGEEFVLFAGVEGEGARPAGDALDADEFARRNKSKNLIHDDA